MIKKLKYLLNKWHKCQFIPHIIQRERRTDFWAGLIITLSADTFRSISKKTWTFCTDICLFSQFIHGNKRDRTLIKQDNYRCWWPACTIVSSIAR